MKQQLQRLLQFLIKLEDGLLAGMLMVLLLLSVGQIVLRNLFSTGLVWGDPLLRVLVLWIALLGAMVATRENNHIRINLAAQWLPQHWQRWSDRVTALFASILCSILAWHSLRFVLFEKQEGILLFSGIPAWICELIIPAAFFIMAWRLLLQALLTPTQEQADP